MATYKVPQNVEAEDKLLGPFTFKQFLYLLGAGFGIILAWLFFKINPWLVVFPILPVMVLLLLGLYHREDQPVETYLVAAFNYLVKPRKRMWDNEGFEEMLKVTKSKQPTPPALKNLESERGQLKRLAQIMDTRGWASKDVRLSEPVNAEPLRTDDRIALPAATKVAREAGDWQEADDVLSEGHPNAQKYENLAETATQIAKEKAIANMKHVQTVAVPAAKAKSTKSAKKSKPLPTHLEFNPYPNIAQAVLDPTTGKRSRGRISKSKVPEAAPAATAVPIPAPVSKMIAELAYNNHLPISNIASKAREIQAAIAMNEGQEVSLHAAN